MDVQNSRCNLTGVAALAVVREDLLALLLPAVGLQIGFVEIIRHATSITRKPLRRGANVLSLNHQTTDEEESESDLAGASLPALSSDFAAT